jgi:sigma-B regulation protein RsbU (phosphoserine phosphatase)
MKSISVRFALASVSVALFVLALIGSVNYFFLKKELLRDAKQKAQLIEINSVYNIHAIISKTERASNRVKKALQKSDFKKESIEKLIKQTLLKESDFYAMAMAFEPSHIYKEPFSPYYYKKDKKIVYTDLALNNYNYLQKEWYKAPKKAKKPTWSEPYFDEGGGDILMATYGNPIIVDGTFIGVLTIDHSLQKLQNIISKIHILKSGYAFLLSKEFKILLHKDSSKIMQQYHKSSIEYGKIIKENNQWLYYAHIPSTNLTLGIVLPHKELFSSLHKMSLISIILAGSGSILLIITMVIISRRISRPIKEVTKLTHEISLGDFNKKLNLPKREDEIYELSLSINRMQDSIRHYISDLKEATIREQKIESELNIARDIQMSMLPKQLQTDDMIEIDALLKPAKAVGGDFYDYFYITKDKICLVIADVSGKGVPAAMFMAVCISYIRAYATTQTTATDIVIQLNNSITKNSDTNLFVTLFLAVLDIKSGTLEYVNAGHNEPYILSPTNKPSPLISLKEPVAGAFPDMPYSAKSVSLRKNEKLFLYTDGVTEAFSKDDEQFGKERLESVLQDSKTLSSKEIIKSVENSLENFSKECEQSDDITMVCVEIFC